MTDSWKRGEATDSLCGLSWLNLDEVEAVKIFDNFYHSVVTFFTPKWSRNVMNVNNSWSSSTQFQNFWRNSKFSKLLLAWKNLVCMEKKALTIKWHFILYDNSYFLTRYIGTDQSGAESSRESMPRPIPGQEFMTRVNQMGIDSIQVFKICLLSCQNASYYPDWIELPQFYILGWDVFLFLNNVNRCRQHFPSDL